jgi:uncharacterized repeat protein (TIGR01451 family)
MEMSSSTDQPRRTGLALIVASIVSVALLCLPTAASARSAHASGTGLIVTVAARECPTYQDIRANLARNDIMESLQDLGEDTLYEKGEPVNPKLELEGQPNCKPITGWQFTLGSGLKEKASTGVWGALSIVTGAELPTVATDASTPLLGWNGEPVKGPSIKGATTFELSQAQAERAAGGNLWIQGGTTTDPVLFSAAAFAGKYGFGALRCSIDDLNGDNVETIAFPTGTTHAFCYAYYVTPPPSSGTIVIRKEVEGQTSTAQDFQFGGNVSYNPGGAFDLAASPGKPAETTFFRGETRAGEKPWTVQEEVPDGWALTGLHCESASSQVTTDRGSATVSIRLAAGDTVTCTYVDELNPPKGALLIRKVTEDGTGTFDFRVLGSGDKAVKTLRIKTNAEDKPAYAQPLVVDPGQYRVVEHSPRDPRGEWHTVSANCNGEAEKSADEATVSISESSGAVCTFTNRLVHPGRITIRKEAIGGTGSAGFQITSPAYPTRALNQTAVVKKERSPVLAKGDASRGLPFGTYVIQESAGHGTDPSKWSLVEVICDGKALPFSQGRAVVHLSQHDPSANCRFVNLFTPAPKPPGPGPNPPAPGPSPGESAEIAVSKTLVSTSAGPTPTSLYRVTVKNLSGVTASDVVVTDQPGPGLVIVKAEPSGGASCIHATQYLCSFPSIAPHGEEAVLVTAKDYGGGGTYNRAVLSSASPDENASNNVAAARTKKPVRNYPACGSSVAVAARC